MAIIPLVHQLPNHEAQRWLDQLKSVLPDFDIRDHSTIQLHELISIEVAIVANPDPIDLMQYPNLIWVHSLWAGVEKMMAQLDDYSFGIVRLIDPMLAKTMSEAVLSWVLYLHRDMPSYQRQQGSQLWQPLAYVAPSQRRVLILGLGELGQCSAKRLLGNDFHVMGWSSRVKGLTGIEEYAGDSGLAEALSKADILVNLLPLTPQTRHLLNQERLHQLPQGSRVINFGRGATIHHPDLIEALNSGHLSHAVLDVFDEEPLPKDSPLWQHEKVTLLPHISAPTSQESACQIVAHNIEQYFVTGNLPPTVDKQKGY